MNPSSKHMRYRGSGSGKRESDLLITLRRKHGAESVSFLAILKEQLIEEGESYLDVSDPTDLELLAEEHNLEFAKIESILGCCARIGLIHGKAWSEKKLIAPVGAVEAANRREEAREKERERKRRQRSKQTPATTQKTENVPWDNHGCPPGTIADFQAESGFEPTPEKMHITNKPNVSKNSKFVSEQRDFPDLTNEQKMTHRPQTVELYSHYLEQRAAKQLKGMPASRNMDENAITALLVDGFTVEQIQEMITVYMAQDNTADLRGLWRFKDKWQLSQNRPASIEEQIRQLQRYEKIRHARLGVELNPHDIEQVSGSTFMCNGTPINPDEWEGVA